jgi:hypothetical protein
VLQIHTDRLPLAGGVSTGTGGDGVLGIDDLGSIELIEPGPGRPAQAEGPSVHAGR